MMGIIGEIIENILTTLLDHYILKSLVFSLAFSTLYPLIKRFIKQSLAIQKRPVRSEISLGCPIAALAALAILGVFLPLTAPAMEFTEHALFAMLAIEFGVAILLGFTTER
jgi:hypothetical protein